MTKLNKIYELGVNCSLRDQCGLIPAKTITPDVMHICSGEHYIEVRHSLYKYDYTFQTVRPEMYITKGENNDGN